MVVSSANSGGSVAIKVNNETGHYFQTTKGLRQGESAWLPPAEGGIDESVLLPQLCQQALLIP